MKKAQPGKESSELPEFVFPAGLYGFPESKSFAVHSIPGAPDFFRQMVCLDTPGIILTLVDPTVMRPDYNPAFTAEDVEAIGAKSVEDLVVLTVVTLSSDPKKITVNLRAPILFNPFNRLARQVILSTDAYSVKHPLIAGA